MKRWSLHTLCLGSALAVCLANAAENASGSGQGGSLLDNFMPATTGGANYSAAPAQSSGANYGATSAQSSGTNYSAAPAQSSGANYGATPAQSSGANDSAAPVQTGGTGYSAATSAETRASAPDSTGYGATPAAAPVQSGNEAASATGIYAPGQITGTGASPTDSTGNATSGGEAESSLPAGDETALPPGTVTEIPGLPPLPAPVADGSASGGAASQPLSGSITVAQMGQPRGLLLTGGQLQSGINFTLPSDEVITHARLDLSLTVSSALAARNTSLRLTMNGQPLATIPLSASGKPQADYQIDIPAAMVVSSNNLGFTIDNASQLMCERDTQARYQVTILPKTLLSFEGQQLNLGTRLSNFPRPFLDPQRMTSASVAMVFGDNFQPGEVSAAAILASWLGMQADYRGIAFPVLRGQLPEQNGIVFGHPGEQIAGLTLPESSGALLQLVDNPNNPVYKLLLVVGSNDVLLRQAATRLLQPLNVNASRLEVGPISLPPRKAYDAPRWINTDRPVRLSELLRQDQNLTTTGIWHDALRVNFRAAPDLFLWDGETLPLQLNYRFPSESWIDENASFLNATLNGTSLRNLPVNKEGLLENIWHRLGGDARQENATLQLDPYLIYGDNQLQLYFNIKPKADAPCSVLNNNNIKSRIEDDSSLDLSHTRHFAMLPNLSYFVGASFPFSRLADFSQTVLMLPEKPANAEVSALLSMAARSGNATGVALTSNNVIFGLPQNDDLRERLQGSDVLAVTTLAQTVFNRALLAESPYQVRDRGLGVRVQTTQEKLRSWLVGDWSRQSLDADRYLSSTESWRGFLSYRSPWDPKRLVVVTMATDGAQLGRLSNDLNLPRINAGIRGDTAIISSENGIRSFRVGPQFPSGQMPWYMMIVWYASQHAVLLALVALFCSTLVGLSVCVLLRRHAWRRLHPKNPSRPSGEKKE